MAKKNMLHKSFALVLVLCMAFMTMAPAFAASEEDAKKAAFDALPDDAIVCYMYGQPVYKYEVDENGYVDKDFGATVITRSSGSNGTLPTAHRGETITASVTLVTTGFSQTENIIYAPCEYAYDAIKMIEDGASTVDAALELAGGIIGSPIVTEITSLLRIIVSMGATDLCNDITDNSENGDDSQIEYVTSNYGQFYNVSTWNGRTVVRDGYTSGSTVVTVNSVNCSHGSVWN